ncbi:MAG: hypothetical protein L6R37_004406 [Teloschistes peruensis]|nr:MAG: hypothetical protein L6R37_004406 [Teloschistes peruensis]
MLSEDVSFGVLLWTETPAPHDRKTRKIYSAMFCKEDLEPSDVGLSHYFLGTYKGHDDKKTQLSFRNGLTVATCQCCAPPVTETFSYCILHMVVMKVRNSVIKGLDVVPSSSMRTAIDWLTLKIAQAVARGPSAYFTQGDCRPHWQTSSPIAKRVWIQQTYVAEAVGNPNTTGKNDEADNHTATINSRAKLSRATIHPPLSRKNSSLPPTNPEHIHQLTHSTNQPYPVAYVADPAEHVRPYGKLLPPSAANPKGPVGAKAEDSYVLVPRSWMMPPHSGGVGSGEADKGGELQTVSEGEDEEEFFDVGDELVEWEIV